MKTAYRGDIDGLRAVAILPVVLYHLGVARVTGGYVGVDVFFVISGFLITGIIDPEIRSGTYSTLEFYARRARRIFPALFVMLACVGLVSAAIVVPGELGTIRNALLATLGFVSNIFFYKTQNYFLESSDTNFLLHTWSLAVEEQFYILFPLVLVVLHRVVGDRTRFVVAALGAASLLLSIVTLRHGPQAAFYLLPSRAWELLLGSVLAMRLLPRPASPLLASAVGLGGLALIGWSIVTYTSATAFPGLAAVPPCLGAAMVLWAGTSPQAWSARLLALPPLRFIGLISYSLYLWHWPVIELHRYLTAGPPDLRAKAGMLLVSIGLATASWLLIERPARVRSLVAGRAVTLRYAVGGLAGMAVLVAALPLLGSLVWRPTPEADRVMALLEAKPEALQPGSCFLTSMADNFDLFDPQSCLRLSADRPNVLVMGDSHAAHLVSGLASNVPGINVLRATASGCRPVLPLSGKARCTSLMDYVITDFLPRHPVDAVVLSAAWREHDAEAAGALIERIKPYARRVILVGPSFELSQPLPRLIARRMMSKSASPVAVDDTVFALEDDMARYAGDHHIEFYSLLSRECHAKACTETDDDGMPIYFDSNHFTEAAARRFTRELPLP